MKKILFIALLLLILSSSAYCVEVPKTFGILFNIESLLLDLQSFQSGIGVKYINNLNSVRGLFGFFYANNTSTLLLDLGGAYLRYFWLRRVSPYFGISLGGGIISQTDKTDSENWTKNMTYSASAGPILGVEVFITKFLSIFAEYMILFEVQGLRAGVSTDGEVDWAEMDWSYVIDASLGNNSKVGITVYFSDVIDTKKDN